MPDKRNAVMSSATTAVAINLSGDTTAKYLAIYVGTSGSIKVDTADGQVGVTFTNVPVGILPVAVTKIYSTANGTTASGLIGLSW